MNSDLNSYLNLYWMRMISTKEVFDVLAEQNVRVI